MRKFAWLPRKVDTWRRVPGSAIVWMQWYHIEETSPFVALNCDLTPGRKYCLYIGKFSKEI